MEESLKYFQFFIGILAITIQPAIFATDAQAQRSGQAVMQRVLSLRNEAQRAKDAGDYAKESLIRQKLVSFIVSNRGGNTPLHAQALNDLAMNLVARGKFGEAENLQRSAVSIAQRRFPPTNASMLAMIANFTMILAEQSKFAEALQQSTILVDRYEQALGPGAPQTLNMKLNHAQYLVENGQLDAGSGMAEAVYRLKSERLGPTHLETLDAARITANVISRSLGPRRSLPFHTIAVDGFRNKLGTAHLLTLKAMADYATALSDLGRYDEAIPLHRETLAALSSTLGPSHPTTLTVETNLAKAESASGKSTDGVSQLKLLYEQQSAANGADSQRALSTLAGYADALIRKGRKGEAVAVYSDIAQKAKNSLGASNRLHLNALRSLAYLKSKDSPPSEIENVWNEYARELDAAGQRWLPDRDRAMMEVARAQLKQPGREGMAFEVMKSVYEGMDYRRTDAGFDPNSTAIYEAAIVKQGTYHHTMLDAAWASGSKTGAALSAAFEAMQRVAINPASRALAQAAGRKLASSRGNQVGSLLREHQRLGDELAENQRALSKALSQVSDVDTNISEERKKNERLISALSAVELQMREQIPAYFDIVRPTPLTLTEAQVLLAPNEAFLLIAPTAMGTHIMAVTKTALEWKRSDETEGNIGTATRRLLWDVGADVDVDLAQTLAWEEEGQGAYPFARGTAYELYQSVVEPVEKELEGMRHVYIAASGALSSLPFAILVTEPPVGADGDPAALRATKWLADKHALIQIPSIQSLALLRKTETQISVKSSFTGYGNPVLTGASETRGADRTKRSGNRNSSAGSAEKAYKLQTSGELQIDPERLRALANLPGTAVELEAIRMALNAPVSAVHLANEATETAIRNDNLRSTDILVIATHGLLAGEVDGAMEPGLVFTPPTIASAEDDGLLTTSEIAEMDIGASWVVLSACNTAAGDGSNGSPGLSGLVRSFFFAGAQSILASHWPVRDDVAARLTVSSIELEKTDETLSRAEAFQRAMSEIRNDASGDTETDTLAHPNAWAPFTLIGDAGS